jgi:cellulose synthase (UDP-forming)
MQRLKAEYVDKYVYCPENAYYFKLLGFFGSISIILLVYGLTRFFNLSIWYWVIFGPIALATSFNRFTRFTSMMFYPKFDRVKHENLVRSFWQSYKEPSVDVFLPWAGEDISVFEDTLLGVKNLDYINFKVYVLDDKGSDKIKALTLKYSFNYLSRKNKGEFRKAGNLQHGYDNSNGEFVLVLDADFIPRADALRQTVPYIALKSNIGILQTPQYFEQTKALHDLSKIEFGGGNVVEDFYRIDMPSRDVFGAAMCVGTSALYRRKAILETGGTPKVWGTEDVKQGLQITKAGYRVKYLPVVVSIGRSPDTLQGYYRQHDRWCTGSMATIFGPYYKDSNLTNIWAHVIYLTNGTYYIAEAGHLIFSFHLIALLLFHYESLNIYNSIWFVPFMIIHYILTPLSRITKPEIGTYIAAFSNIYAYFYTLPNIPFKRILPWLPAGVSQSNIQKEYHHIINLGLIISSFFILAFIFTILKNPDILGNYNTYPTLFGGFYSIFWQLVFLFAATKYIKDQEMPLLSEFKGLKVFHKKALLHLKNYALPYLALVLFSTAIYTANLKLNDPSSPTVLAVNSLINPKASSKGSSVALVNPVSTFVLGTTSYNVVADESKNIIATAKVGDSLSSLTHKAILEYSQQKHMEVDKKKLLTIEINLMQAYKDRKIKTGDKLVFEQSKIEELLEKSQ